jgi:hypothetical protein
MKRLLAVAAALLIASSAFAGLTYRIESVTQGGQGTTFSGTVSVEGSRMRFDVSQGDGMLFKNGTVVLSSDGGKTMAVFDPSDHTYYDLQLDKIVNSTTSLLNSMGGMVKIDFKNPSVNVRDGGDGGTIEGYPTHKYILEASYDIAIDAMGQKMTMHTVMSSQNWTTDQLSGEFTSFVQARGLRTGIEAVDRLIEAQAAGMHGFPLKQETSVQVQGGADVNVASASNVTHIERHTIDAAQFTAPQGYNKVDDPITRMIRRVQ